MEGNELSGDGIKENGAACIVGKPRLRRAEASRYLLTVHGISCSVSTLASLACRGGGPTFEHFGRHPHYRPEALDEWVLRKLSKPKTSTSQ